MSEILENEQRLSANEYPGRGIIQGLGPDGESAIQIYWLEGRSEGSRNRILEENEGVVRTAPYKEVEGEDHSLTIYNAMRGDKVRRLHEKYDANFHIVSNGHQTDPIFEKVSHEQYLISRFNAFGEALLNWAYEPDKPNFTPRISGMIYIQNLYAQSRLSIIKRVTEYGEIDRSLDATEFLPTPEVYERNKGLGKCVHTYDGDGDPIPSFSGDPYTVGLEQTAEENAEKFAEILAGDNFVSLVAKAIPLDGSKPTFHIINKNQ